MQIRGGHEDGHQLESLHSYGVPSPPRRGQNSSRKKVIKLTTFFSKNPFAKSRSIDGSNRFILRGDRECVVRIPRESQAAMTLPEIGGDQGRPRPTDFRRRGPWGAHFARSGNIPNTPHTGSDTPMGRRPGELNHHNIIINNNNSNCNSGNSNNIMLKVYTYQKGYS